MSTHCIVATLVCICVCVCLRACVCVCIILNYVFIASKGMDEAQQLCTDTLNGMYESKIITVQLMLLI